MTLPIVYCLFFDSRLYIPTRSLLSMPYVDALSLRRVSLTVWLFLGIFFFSFVSCSNFVSFTTLYSYHMTLGRVSYLRASW